MPKQELLRVRADFNEVDEDNRLHVLPRQADRPDALVVGARVLLSDDEGSTMLGDVIERTERLAAIQVLPRTWRNPRAPADPAWASTAISAATFTAIPEERYWLFGGWGQVTFLLLPHHGSRWWESAEHSVGSTAPTTAQPLPAGR